ncbi:DNA-3-methyladenine glycosylase, partial [Streptococcus pneumoniae]|uniref:DNA-3-methyladenine glycosylase n=1 Tax=Streptococcus pneumoniae TaxID=1313 RepID=UPI0021D4E3D7
MHTHLLINLVTREEGIPEGVLIRAVEPEDGIETMKINRNKSGFELTNGPGKWTKAFNIPRAIDGSTINQCRLYQRGGTIYGHVMHTHLLINLVTREEGIPEGV